ncbi:MAG TPA: tRNA (N(6)-L-threonylcarbamoyladenosine(37)-C(2))-methylthiotransferase MtaB [Bacteroidales bacterium]|nr:tRNA (N(6)-L-threonylcarbamoyladenosine(37)-C(2))-methylthiotransferase MtaB [Bacteroidales bacterium]
MNKQENNKKRTVAFHTLGCKLNFAETATIARKFEEKGFGKTNFSNKSDIYVINTCSVTGQADKKCRQAIKKAIRQSPEAYIVVLGCYAQLKSEEIAAIKGVDLVLGTKNKFKAADLIEDLTSLNEPKIYSCGINDVGDFNPSFSLNERTRGFLKVQDGCDYKCSYCTIPFARGKSRNQTIELTVQKAEEMAAGGVKEIVITGVNVGDFGRSTGENLLALIQNLEKVNGIERYRISSIEPNLLTDDIINFVKGSDRFMPHFHIPLQSGCNKILKLMRRRYLREVFAERVNRIKSAMPDAFIGVDVIVGFPEETEEDFDETYEFLKILDISFLHVFSYSERENTLAASMSGKVPEYEKQKRSKKLLALSEIKHQQFYNSHLNNKYDVLFESTKNKGKMYGYTGNYIKTETPYNRELIGTLRKVRLTGVEADGNASFEFIDRL